MRPLYFTTISHAVNEQWTLPMGTFLSLSMLLLSEMTCIKRAKRMHVYMTICEIYVKRKDTIILKIQKPDRQ